MAERIYTRGDGGAIEALEEEPFSTEDELQSLIAEHPELLDGEQIRPGDPRRWVLITREKGIAETPDSGARWSIDHLIVDQDAVPTLAEVKRGSNPEIRRTIVGQMLEYAAHGVRTWTAGELRRTFEESANAQGHNPGEVLGRLLQTDGEPDADGFWEKVSTNLSASRMRLLFVADENTGPPRARCGVSERTDAQRRGACCRDQTVPWRADTDTRSARPRGGPRTHPLRD